MEQEKQTIGTLGKNGDSVILDVEGLSSAGIQIDNSGTLVGTVTFQGSIDGKTFFNMSFTDLPTGATASSTTSFPAYKKVPCAGLKAIKVLVTAYTSGSSNVFMKANNAGYFA